MVKNLILRSKSLYLLRNPAKIEIMPLKYIVTLNLNIALNILFHYLLSLLALALSAIFLRSRGKFPKNIFCLSGVKVVQNKLYDSSLGFLGAIFGYLGQFSSKWAKNGEILIFRLFFKFYGQKGRQNTQKHF